MPTKKTRAKKKIVPKGILAAQRLEALALLKKTFSLRNVRARYKKIGHKPTRGSYGRRCDLPGESCLLGSFEHAIAGCLGEENGTTIRRSAARHSELPVDLLRSMEAGWEEWGRRFMGKPGSVNEAAYKHGQHLAKKLGLEE